MELFKLHSNLRAQDFVSVSTGCIERDLLVAALKIPQGSLCRGSVPLGSHLPSGEQMIGHVGQGTGDDYRLLRHALLHDANRAPDRCCIRQRGAAELHDDRLRERCRSLSRLLRRYFTHGLLSLGGWGKNKNPPPFASGGGSVPGLNFWISSAGDLHQKTCNSLSLSRCGRLYDIRHGCCKGHLTYLSLVIQFAGAFRITALPQA